MIWMLAADSKWGLNSQTKALLKEFPDLKVDPKKDIVYKVTLSDGTEFKVTDDHKWLVKTGSKYLWKETNQANF